MCIKVELEKKEVDLGGTTHKYKNQSKSGRNLTYGQFKDLWGNIIKAIKIK